MKKVIPFLLFFPIVLAASSREKCTIRQIYKRMDLPAGSKSLAYYCGTEKLEKILVPIEMENGKYKISFTREKQGLYKVQDQNIYFETDVCLELSVTGEAFLIINNFGLGKGEIIFD